MLPRVLIVFCILIHSCYKEDAVDNRKASGYTDFAFAFTVLIANSLQDIWL